MLRIIRILNDRESFYTDEITQNLKDATSVFASAISPLTIATLSNNHERLTIYCKFNLWIKHSLAQGNSVEATRGEIIKELNNDILLALRKGDKS